MKKYLLIGIGFILSQILVLGIISAISSGNWSDILTIFKSVISGLPYIIGATVFIALPIIILALINHSKEVQR